MTSTTLELLINQTERLTVAEQWELLTHLVQRLRQTLLPPAMATPPSFSEQWPPSPTWQSESTLSKEENQHRPLLSKKNLFPPTRVEEVAGCLKYAGPPKTLADMEDAIRLGILESWHESN